MSGIGDNLRAFASRLTGEDTSCAHLPSGPDPVPETGSRRGHVTGTFFHLIAEAGS